MSEDKSVKKSAREALEEWLASDPPYLSAEEIARKKAEQIRREKEEALKRRQEGSGHNRKVLELDPYGRRHHRKWQVSVDKTTSYVQKEPDIGCRIMEIREAVAREARLARMHDDPDNVGGYSEFETIADVIRRQDETR